MSDILASIQLENGFLVHLHRNRNLYVLALAVVSSQRLITDIEYPKLVEAIPQAAGTKAKLLPFDPSIGNNNLWHNNRVNILFSKPENVK